MFARNVLPHLFDFGRDTAQIGDDQIVLGIEVTVERHLVGAGCFGNGVDTDTADAVAVEQIACSGKNAFAGPWGDGKGVGHFASSVNDVVPPA